MINYVDKGEGLLQHLSTLGVFIYWLDDNIQCILPENMTFEDVNTIIQDYNPWSHEKAVKFAEIDVDFQHSIDSLTAGWPEGEIKTWNKQEAEALTLQQNPNAVTPTLSMIAVQRGITIPELASRVLRDAAAFSQASGYYVGLRHKARQLVQALPNEGSYERLQELYNIKFGG